jgi:hypothetical protein
VSGGETTKVELLDRGVRIGEEYVEAFAASAITRLCEVFGPQKHFGSIGVEGSGRAAHFLESGVILLTGKGDTTLLAMFFCFNGKDSSPYPDVAPEVASFDGEVTFRGMTFRGGETGGAVLRIPGIRGFGGAHSVRYDNLYVSLDLQRPRNRFGQRAGAPTLVRLSAEWGGLELVRLHL